MCKSFLLGTTLGQLPFFRLYGTTSGTTTGTTFRNSSVVLTPYTPAVNARFIFEVVGIRDGKGGGAGGGKAAGSNPTALFTAAVGLHFDRIGCGGQKAADGVRITGSMGYDTIHIDIP